MSPSYSSMFSVVGVSTLVLGMLTFSVVGIAIFVVVGCCSCFMPNVTISLLRTCRYIFSFVVSW